MRGSNLTTSGTLSYNGFPNISSFANAYVTQADVLLPTLTVRETLRYAASLRLPSSTTEAQRNQLVEEIILELGLKECAETRVGDGGRQRGCSGGERRRVSIGVQMLGNPSVLFLDEPTTGLDATSAFHLVRTLKHLAIKGRTIIATIHQPRSDTFFLFDRITLLSRGNCVYSGPTEACLMWFDGLLPGGLKPHVNPADYLIDMATVDNRTHDVEAMSQARLDRLLSAWRDESERIFSALASVALPGPTSEASARKKITKSSPLRQIYVLTSRDITTTIRDPLGFLASWTEAILLSLACGLIFLNLPRSLAGIRLREGALYTAVSMHPYIYALYDLYRLTTVDMALFDRERGEGIIGVVPWMISRRLSRGLLEDIIVPFLFSVIFYFLCGFEATAAKFFTFLGIMIVQHYVTVCFALLSAAVSRDFSVASLFANIVYTFQVFSAGYVIQAATMPVYVRWIKWMSCMVSVLHHCGLRFMVNRTRC
jgi:ABC-type multidrug transport system ATPase subunit